MHSHYSKRRAGSAVMLGVASLFLSAAVLAGGNDGGASSTSASAPESRSMTPLNTSSGTAKMLIPDGTSTVDFANNTDTYKWYSLDVEPGKTYVIEAVDTYNDYPAQVPIGLVVYDSDGTTTPPVEAQVSCSRSQQAPSIYGGYGYRCIVRAWYPDFGNTKNRRTLLIRMAVWTGGSYNMRAYESTIYGRWTTNGYQFHVELQNTTGQAICAQVLLYPNAGVAYNTAGVYWAPSSELTVPAYGANKVVFAPGTTAGADTRGTLRIHACPGSVNLVGGALHVSTYAYNTGTGQYLYFFPWKANGTNGNSF